MVRGSFIHNYCKTCHNFQGSSIDGYMMIFDWKFKHVDRKWTYTACTRAMNMAKVPFYRYEEEDEQELLDKFLEAKVERYKQQDRKANRDIEDDNYITAEWLKKAYGSSCGNCGDCLAYTIRITRLSRTSRLSEYTMGSHINSTK